MAKRQIGKVVEKIEDEMAKKVKISMKLAGLPKAHGVPEIDRLHIDKDEAEEIGFNSFSINDPGHKIKQIWFMSQFQELEMNLKESSEFGFATKIFKSFWKMAVLIALLAGLAKVPGDHIRCFLSSSLGFQFQGSDFQSFS